MREGHDQTRWAAVFLTNMYAFKALPIHASVPFDFYFFEKNHDKLNIKVAGGPDFNDGKILVEV